MQQLSYLTACAKGLSDPEGDLVDLDASFDDAQAVKDAALRLLQDPRIESMRAQLGNVIENSARLWAADAEVVQVSCRSLDYGRRIHVVTIYVAHPYLQALSDYIRCTTADAVPSPLALDSFALFTLTATASSHAGGPTTSSSSPVWLSIAGSLVARLAREQSDQSLSLDDLARVGRPVEVALEGVLGIFTDVTSEYQVEMGPCRFDQS